MQCLINLLDQDTVEALCDSFPKINSADLPKCFFYGSALINPPVSTSTLL